MPPTVSGFVKELQGELLRLTVKQHLAALRTLSDWLVTGHILDVNRAMPYAVSSTADKKGKTPVLTAEETRGLLDSNAIARKPTRGGAYLQNKGALEIAQHIPNHELRWTTKL